MKLIFFTGRPPHLMSLHVWTLIGWAAYWVPLAHTAAELRSAVVLADASTNLEQPTLNHVQSDTMTSAVLADPPRALHGTNRGSGPAMEESENDVGSLEKLLLYADEHYFAGKLPLGDHLGKVPHGV
ncbi:15-hydroxyprostaglandin dehydrogenase [Trichonephila clavipes]|nr:15-hydroxyprostaglandin dehydrogenase [Trichonephila clavipes]